MTTAAMPATRHYHDLERSLPSMAGKTVLITGCTSGTGLVLAKTCGQLGARVVMLNRPSVRADVALQALTESGADAVFVACDLADFAAVRKAGATLRDMFAESGCDVLCNNAGIMGMPDEATVDGFDTQMQANHLSHFLLTHEVWPLLETAAAQRGEARVVNHSSGARGKPGQELIAKYLQRNGGKLGGDGFPGHQKWIRYRQSKLANLMFTYALHEHATARPGNAVKALCAHPGPTATGLQEKTAAAGGTRWFDRRIIRQTLEVAHSTEDGTCGIARCCCAPDVQSGEFYGPAQRGAGGAASLLPPERNPANEARLWTESLKATEIAAFFP